MPIISLSSMSQKALCPSVPVKRSPQAFMRSMSRSTSCREVTSSRKNSMLSSPKRLIYMFIVNSRGGFVNTLAKNSRAKLTPPLKTA